MLYRGQGSSSVGIGGSGVWHLTEVGREQTVLCHASLDQVFDNGKNSFAQLRHLVRYLCC